MYEKIKLDYNSLMPYIDEKTLDLHYNTHYNNYINKLNELLVKNNYNYIYSMEELVDRIDMFNLEDRAEILFNLGGSLNHELYFYTMSLNKNNKPIFNLKKEIDESFGSYDKFKDEFIKKALELKGSGYTFLVLNNNKLQIINTSNQDTPLSYGFKPILTLDVWEHAYYLKHNAKRKDYINDWFEIVDYQKAEENYNRYKK